MKDNQSLEEQRKRLGEALKFLKDRGKGQEKIAEEINMDAANLSRLKSGKVKKIPDEFLEKLQEKYDINPGYIRGTSDILLNSIGTKLKNFEGVVNSWDTVYKGENHYLHLQMDSKFYDFLVEYDKHRLADLKSFSIDDAVKKLEDIFADEPKIKEYVILPRNVFVDFAKEVKDKRKALAEILDPPDPENIPDTWNLKLKKQQDK